MTVRINASDTLASLAVMEEAFNAAAAHALRDAVKDGERNARETTTFRDRTGALRKSIVGVVYAGEWAGTLFAGRPYALYVERGTRPHVIRPKEGYGLVGPMREGQSRRALSDVGTHRVALRWFDNPTTRTGIHFARVVHHPGTRPTLFLQRAGDYAGRALADGMEDAVERALREAS